MNALSKAPLLVKHPQSFWLPDDIWQNVFQMMGKKEIQFTDSDFDKQLDRYDRVYFKSFENLLKAIQRETEKMKPFYNISRVCKTFYIMNKINLTTVSNAFVDAMLKAKIAFEDLLYPKRLEGCGRDISFNQVSLFELAFEKDSKYEVIEVIFRATIKCSGCSDNEFLTFVCRKGWSKAVDHILRVKPNVLRDIPKNDRTPLHAAAEKGHLCIVQQLLKAAGKQAHKLLLRKDGLGRTAREVAETSKQYQTAEYLKENEKKMTKWT